jgi:hypothetical protein
MAASDNVPILLKNRLHLAGRPQMSTRPIRSESGGTARLSAAAREAILARAAGELTETAPDATTILSRDDGGLGVECGRLGGRSRAKQQPPLFSTIQVCPGPAAHSTARLGRCGKPPAPGGS